jgi:hypothetical protein
MHVPSVYIALRRPSHTELNSQSLLDAARVAVRGGRVWPDAGAACSAGLTRVWRGWTWCEYNRVGKEKSGDKNITFLTEMLPKLRFLCSFHFFGHHAT